jgi:DNA invertase Pin-like site-specific DNA recombinase
LRAGLEGALNVALYARTSAADHDKVTCEGILAELGAVAAHRGWEVTARYADRNPWLQGRRSGLEALKEAVRVGALDLVVVRSLAQIARNLRHLTELGRFFAAHEVGLVALADDIDTTDPGGALRWQDWLRIAAAVDREVRSEHVRIARLRSSTPWGAPMVAVNPLELLGLWEGRAGRRPLSQRQIAKRLAISEATVRSRLRELREDGKVDDDVRRRRLQATGGLNKGGRPAKPLDDAEIAAAWARYRSTTGVARALRVGRARLAARLREMGLLAAKEGV